jgi:hypothetical protein
MAYEQSPKAQLRFSRHVRKTDGCWEWTRSLKGAGYGQFVADGKPHYAHRWAWESVHGPIAQEMVVCHKCDNRRCVRPSHLFLGTQKDNIADMYAKGRERRGDQTGAKNGMARVKDIDPAQVTALFDAGQRVRDIAPLFGISKSTVSNIVRRQHWSNRNGI